MSIYQHASVADNDAAYLKEMDDFSHANIHCLAEGCMAWVKVEGEDGDNTEGKNGWCQRLRF